MTTSNVKDYLKMSVLVVSIIVAIAAVIGFSSQFFYGPDNKIEEACEEAIKLETGADVDLSPDSPESSTGTAGVVLDAPVQNGIPANIDLEESKV